MLGLGLAAGSVLARWRASGRRVKATLAAAAGPGDRRGLPRAGHQQLPLAFSRARPSRDRSRALRSPRSSTSATDGIPVRPAGIRRDPGIRADAQLPPRRADAAEGTREPGYRGEAWTAEGEVRPVSWSPNRLVFRVGRARRSSSIRIPARGGGSTAAAASRGCVCRADACRSPRGPTARAGSRSGSIRRDWDSGSSCISSGPDC